jgi:hypothetical protein
MQEPPAHSGGDPRDEAGGFILSSGEAVEVGPADYFLVFFSYSSELTSLISEAGSVTSFPMLASLNRTTVRFPLVGGRLVRPAAAGIRDPVLLGAAGRDPCHDEQR